jgi:hypothetical protein
MALPYSWEHLGSACSSGSVYASSSTMSGAVHLQAVLAKCFLAGREITMAMLGERKLRVLRTMELILIDASDPHPIYTSE